MLFITLYQLQNKQMYFLYIYLFVFRYKAAHSNYVMFINNIIRSYNVLCLKIYNYAFNKKVF